jgi:hypothetical protein
LRAKRDRASETELREKRSYCVQKQVGWAGTAVYSEGRTSAVHPCVVGHNRYPRRRTHLRLYRGYRIRSCITTCVPYIILRMYTGISRHCWGSARIHLCVLPTSAPEPTCLIFERSHLSLQPLNPERKILIMGSHTGAELLDAAIHTATQRSAA